MATQLTPVQYEYQKAYGLWFGSIFAAAVGLMWTGIFSSFIGGVPRVVLLIIFLLVGVYALVNGLTMRRSHRLMKSEKLPYLHSWSFWLKFYGVIIVEFLAIFLIIHMLMSHHVPNVVFPVIVFVVGAHFYPLARWNGTKLWYFTASILCGAIALLTIIVPADATTNILGANNSSVWALVSSGVMVVTLLATSLVSGVLYKRLVTVNS